MKYLQINSVFESDVVDLIENCITGREEVNTSTRKALEHTLYSAFTYVSDVVIKRDNLHLVTLNDINEIAKEFQNAVNSLPEN